MQKNIDQLPIGKQLLLKYPDKIPIVLHYYQIKQSDGKTVQKILLPADKTIAYLISDIRKRTNISASEAIYIFVNELVPSNSSTIEMLHTKFKSEKDYCLHMVVAKENTFG